MKNIAYDKMQYNSQKKKLQQRDYTTKLVKVVYNNEQWQLITRSINALSWIVLCQNNRVDKLFFDHALVLSVATFALAIFRLHI